MRHGFSFISLVSLKGLHPGMDRTHSTYFENHLFFRFVATIFSHVIRLQKSKSCSNYGFLLQNRVHYHRMIRLVATWFQLNQEKKKSIMKNSLKSQRNRNKIEIGKEILKSHSKWVQVDFDLNLYNFLTDVFLNSNLIKISNHQKP